MTASVITAGVRRRRRSVDGWALGAGGVLVVIVAVAVFGPLVVDSGGGAPLGDRLIGPFAEKAAGGRAILGTDHLGRDLLPRAIDGLRTSLLIAGCATCISALFGTIIGLVAGYFGGWLDSFIVRTVDIVIVFPSILLAIVIAGLFGPSIVNLIIILAATRWIVFARVVRASTLSLRERDWVKSSKVLGVSDLRIIQRHIVPFLAAPLATVATLEFAAFVMTEASLSFLGVGLPTTTKSLGKLISEGREYLDSAWWISTLPGVVLVVTVVVSGILGDRLSDSADRTALAAP